MWQICVRSGSPAPIASLKHRTEAISSLHSQAYEVGAIAGKASSLPAVQALLALRAEWRVALQECSR